jgi:hypothetical protein
MAADGSGWQLAEAEDGREEPKNSSTYCSTDGAARVYNMSTSNQPKSSIRQRADDCTRVIRQTSALFFVPRRRSDIDGKERRGATRRCPR